MPTKGGRRRAARRAVETVERRAPRPAPVPAFVPLPDPVPPIGATRPAHTFYYVQRLELPSSPEGRSGFYLYFMMEATFNAHFEVGLQMESIRRMRQAGELGIHTADITYGGITRPVYFVGPLSGIEAKVEDFKLWLDPGRLRGEEWTRFDEMFTERHFGGYVPRTIAWLAFKDDITWTLDPVIADKLLAALTPTN